MKVWSLAKYTSWKSMSPGFRPSRTSESVEDVTRSTVAITSIETDKEDCGAVPTPI
jgi:hypothetical protein